MISSIIAKTQLLFLVFAFISINALAQTKPVQLISQAPSFLVEGDHLLFPCSIKNNTQQDFTGTLIFSIVNKKDNENIDGWFQNSVANQYFTTIAKETSNSYFTINVPYQFTQAISWKIKLQSNNYTDSLQGDISILKNTEAIDSIQSDALIKTFYKKNKATNKWDHLNEWDEITDTDLVKLSIHYTLKKSYQQLTIQHISYAGLIEENFSTSSGYSKNSITLSSAYLTAGSHTFSIQLKPTQKGKFNSGLTELIDPNSKKRIGKGNSLTISIN